MYRGASRTVAPQANTACGDCHVCRAAAARASCWSCRSPAISRWRRAASRRSGCAAILSMTPMRAWLATHTPSCIVCSLCLGVAHSYMVITPPSERALFLLDFPCMLPGYHFSQVSALFVWMTTQCLFRIPTRVFIEAFVRLITTPHRCALYDFIPVAHRRWLGLGLASPIPTLALTLPLTPTPTRWRTAARLAPLHATHGTMTSSPCSPPASRTMPARPLV